MAAAPDTAISATPTPASKVKIVPAVPSIPMGLGSSGGPELASMGANELPVIQQAIPVSAAQATIRQRRDGSEPVGNSSTTNTVSAGAIIQVQPDQRPKASVDLKSWRNRLKIPAV